MRRLRRLVVVVLALVLVAGAAFATVRPFRISVLTAALVPELLDRDPRLLSALVPAPQRITIPFGADASLMDLYLPAGGLAARDCTVQAGAARPVGDPVVVLVLGVNPVPRDHPAVVRTALAISRLGLAVAVPESAAMRSGRIAAADPGALVDAFEALARRPGVDAERIGLAGFSAGGSVALVAAADPRIAERVAWVNAFGAWADAQIFLVDIVTRSTTVGADPVPWSPGELTRSTYLDLALGFLDDPALAEMVGHQLAPWFEGEGLPPLPTFDPSVAALLTGDARVVYELSTARDRAAARAALARLSATARAPLEALSPVRVADRLRAPVYLMHDEADTAIPYGHLERLAAAVPPEALQRVTLFALFDHVQPRGGLDPAALPEVWKLLWHLEAVMDRALP